MKHLLLQLPWTGPDHTRGTYRAELLHMDYMHAIAFGGEQPIGRGKAADFCYRFAAMEAEK